MKTIRRALCAVVVAMSMLAPLVGATAFTTDQSDLWYIQSEPGWGVQLVQRGWVIFATMFVYDHNGAPTWYVATMQHTSNLAWMGDLLATNGPWLGDVPFDPSKVSVRKVGTMTWNAPNVTQGTLTYSVDGVAVTKNVVRQSLVYDNFSGNYGGGMHLISTACSDPSDNGSAQAFVVSTVEQNGQSAAVNIGLMGQNPGELAGVLRITGTLTQDGRFGQVQGSFTTDHGEAGSGHLFEINVQYDSLVARFSLKSTTFGCEYSGHLAVMRVDQTASAERTPAFLSGVHAMDPRKLAQ